MSGYYDHDDEEVVYIPIPEDAATLVDRIAAASVRDDWGHAKILATEAREKWIDEGKRIQRQFVKDEREREERDRLRYRNAYEVCFETSDGVRGVGEISFSHNGPMPRIWKRACRSTIPGLLSAESQTWQPIPVRTYEFLGEYDRTGRPIYKELALA